MRSCRVRVANAHSGTAQRQAHQRIRTSTWGLPPQQGSQLLLAPRLCTGHARRTRNFLGRQSKLNSVSRWAGEAILPCSAVPSLESPSALPVHGVGDPQHPESPVTPDPNQRGADTGGEVECGLGSPRPSTPRRHKVNWALAHDCPLSPQTSPAAEEAAGPALAPTSPLPPQRTCSAGKRPHECRSADKGGNVNTLPSLASQLSEVASASRANSSLSNSHINCGALLPQSAETGPALAVLQPSIFMHLLLSLLPPPSSPGATWGTPYCHPTPAGASAEGVGDPPTPATSASCSDQFCQMKSLSHATLPAVKGPFSLFSVFLTDFSSHSADMPGG